MSLDSFSSLLSFVLIFLENCFLDFSGTVSNPWICQVRTRKCEFCKDLYPIYFLHLANSKGKGTTYHPWASPPINLTLNTRSDTAYLAEPALVWPHLIMCRAPHLKFYMSWQYQHQQHVNIRAVLDFVLLLLPWGAWTEICRTFSL